MIHSQTSQILRERETYIGFQRDTPDPTDDVRLTVASGTLVRCRYGVVRFSNRLDQSYDTHSLPDMHVLREPGKPIVLVGYAINYQYEHTIL